MMKKYIKREIFSDLQAHLKREEITVIIGPRQCGKTTIMNFLVEDLRKQNKNILFLNLDLEEDKKYLESQEKLINKIKLEFGREAGFVFIDEIQRKKQAGIFLKGIYDAKLPCKFIVSGSGNIEIKEKISESLMGRKRLFKMNPINFREFVNFKTNYQYEKKLDHFFEIEEERAENFLWEYFNFGGYPKIITSDTLQEKKIEMNEIYRSYLSKDILEWLKVEKIDAFEKLLKISANQVGNLVEFSNLASNTNLATETAINYLWYLQKTFILKKCSPFFKNKKKEIVKSPLFYFYDLGLRNYVVNQFGTLDDFSGERGFIFENFIFNILNEKIKDTNLKINFWRTKSQAEVDFIIDSGSEIIPIEAKFKKFSQVKIEKSLQSFIIKYKPKRAYVVNKNLSQIVKFKNTEVKFIKFWEVENILILG